jgi:aminopeptidase N
MLRMKLGDTTFQAATRAYIDRFRFKEVETDDFRRVLEEVSGISLESFFDQWVRRPGIPRLEAALDWEAAPSPGPDEGTGQLKVTIKQTQRIDAANPPYEFQLPIEVVLPGGDRRTLTLPIDSAEASAVFALEAKPTDLTFDPMLTVAAPTRITRDLKSAEPTNP